MNIKVLRFNSELNNPNFISEYQVNKSNLLQALIEIKTINDNSLTFRCGCKSGVCGSCAVRVNGIEKLACKTIINENDLIEPIKNSPIIKDLVVDVSHETFLIGKMGLSIDDDNAVNKVTQEDIKKIDLQSNCILCNS